MAVNGFGFGCLPGFGSGRAGKMAGGLCGGRGVLHHGSAAARAEDEAFEQGVAGEAIGAVDAGEGGFAGGVEAGDGGASPKIGFYAAHHEMRGGADGSEVTGEIEAVGESGGEDARETLFEKVFLFRG